MVDFFGNSSEKHVNLYMKAIAITTHKSSFQGLTLPDDFYMRIQKAQIKLDK